MAGVTQITNRMLEETSLETTRGSCGGYGSLGSSIKSSGKDS